eukprot:scaffold182704_cov18-Tisochrysis_lutea.AAC.3
MDDLYCFVYHCSSPLSTQNTGTFDVIICSELCEYMGACAFSFLPGIIIICELSAQLHGMAMKEQATEDLANPASLVIFVVAHVHCTQHFLHLLHPPSIGIWFLSPRQNAILRINE